MSGPAQQPVPWNWFLRRPAYIRFMLRELTAVFVGAYLIFLLVVLRSFGAGEDAFLALLEVLRSPLSVVLHAVVLVGSVWHSITWFNLTPMAVPVFLGEKRVAGPLVAAALGYVPWALVTAVMLWGVTR